MATNIVRAGTAPFAHLLALVTGKAAVAQVPGAEDAPDIEEQDEVEEISEEPADVDGEDTVVGDDTAPADTEVEADPDPEDQLTDPGDNAAAAKARAAGAAAMQARCRKIFSAASAGLRPDMAAHLAFDQSMSSADAIAMLDMASVGMPAPGARGDRLAERMARVIIPNPGTGGGGTSKEANFGDEVKAAMKKAGLD